MSSQIKNIIREFVQKQKACVVLRNPSNATYLIMREFGYHEWTVPKGQIDIGNPKATAIRETWEESNIKITRPDDLKYLGSSDYRGTNLHAFFYEVDKNEAQTELKCNSTWTDHNGEEHPEIDRWFWVPKDKFLSTLKRAQSELFAPFLKDME
jgi:8-oxo-dGTP pyrophosphatase MutT (NUDIX family)